MKITEYGYGDAVTWDRQVPYPEPTQAEEIGERIAMDEALQLEVVYEYLADTELNDLTDAEYGLLDETLKAMDSLIEKSISWKVEKEIKRQEDLEAEACIDTDYFDDF